MIHRDHPISIASSSHFLTNTVLGPSEGQQDLYEAAASRLVEKFLDGFNVTILAFVSLSLSLPVLLSTTRQLPRPNSKSSPNLTRRVFFFCQLRPNILRQILLHGNRHLPLFFLLPNNNNNNDPKHRSCTQSGGGYLQTVFGVGKSCWGEDEFEDGVDEFVCGVV